MKSSSLAFITIVGFAASLCAVEQPKPSDKGASPDAKWITRSFRFAPDIQWRLSLPDEKPSVLPLAPPSVDASEQAWIEHIQKTTLLMEKVLAMDGINLPAGTAFALDASAQTHHYAPASTRKQGGERDEKSRRVEIASTDFHRVSLNSQMTLQKGMTRLIGLWKLEGTPEFDSKDLMQVAFLRLDMMPCTYEEIMSQRK